MAVVLFGGALFLSDGTIDAAYALASLTLMLWTLWLLAIAHGFVEPVPEIDPAARFWARARLKFRRATVWVLAFAMTVLFVMAIVMTIRTIGIAIQAA